MKKERKVRSISRFVLLVMLFTAALITETQKTRAFDSLALMEVIGFTQTGNVLLRNFDNQVMPEVEPPKFKLEKGNLVIVGMSLKYENGNLSILRIKISDLLKKEKDPESPTGISPKGI